MGQNSTGGKKIGINNLALEIHGLQILIDYDPEGIKRLAVGDEKGSAEPILALARKMDRKVQERLEDPSPRGIETAPEKLSRCQDEGAGPVYRACPGVSQGDPLDPAGFEERG